VNEPAAEEFEEMSVLKAAKFTFDAGVSGSINPRVSTPVNDTRPSQGSSIYASPTPPVPAISITKDSAMDSTDTTAAPHGDEGDREQ
jgi:hypothetical protein